MTSSRVPSSSLHFYSTDPSCRARGSLLQVLRARAWVTPDLPAVFVTDYSEVPRPLGWRAYWTLIRHLAAGLKSHGLVQGDRLAIILPSCAEWDLLEKAALRLGVEVVGIEPHLPLAEMRSFLTRSSSVALVTPDRGLAASLRDSLGSPVKLILVRRGEGGEGPGVPWKDFVDSSRAMAPSPLGPLPSAQTPASLLFTSGSTGSPKALRYTASQLLLAARTMIEGMPTHPGDVALSWLPMANAYQRNVNMACLLAGVPLHFLEDPKGLVSALPRIQPSFLIGVPRVFEKMRETFESRVDALPSLLRQPICGAIRWAQSAALADRLGRPQRLFLKFLRATLFRPLRRSLGGRVRYLVTGSAPCRRDVLTFFHAAGLPLLECYGVSECSVPIALSRPSRFRIGSVGLVPLENRVRLADDGEVWVSGPGVFSGYWDTASGPSPVSDDGWYPTGDLGEFDGDGFLYLKGRKTEIIKTSSGRRISLSPLEQRLRQEIPIDQVVLVGHGRPGLVAIVTRSPGQTSPLREPLERFNASLVAWERIGGVIVRDQPFSMDTGELTRNLKICRPVLERRHAESLRAVYACLRDASPTQGRHVAEAVTWWTLPLNS